MSRTPCLVGLLTVCGAFAQPAPLRLEEAVRLALQHQPQVLQAQATSGIAEARFEQSRGTLLPQLTGTASLQRSRNELHPDAFTQLSFGVSATQTLWDFTAIERLRASDRFLDAQRMLERATRLQIVLGVRRAFIDARAQQELVRVAEEALANQLRHQTQIEGFVKAEIRPEIDLAQSRTDVANARVQWVNARNGYRLAIARLHQAIGVPSAQNEIAADELPPVEGETKPIDGLVEEALANRPELKSLELQRASAAFNVGAAWGGFIPTLTASGALSDVGPDPDRLGLNWNVGVLLNWPLFQGGITRGQVHEAQRNAESLSAQEQVQQLQVRLDVESAWLSLEAGQAQIESSNDAVLNARLRLKLAEGRYEAGVGSSIELGDAQIALTNAGAQLVQARFNLSTARAQLLAALGRSP